MSEERKTQFPFKSLGARLKKLRESSRQSQAEVSGAVEIDIEQLINFEQGSVRPSEDILLLLVSHFGLKDEEAVRLWELAGYERREFGGQAFATDDMDQKTPVVILPHDVRIAYTDTVNVVVNNYGVVMNFLQSNGPSNQPLIVSRVGMSREHARSVIEVLQKTLDASEPKSLPAPESRQQEKTD